MSNNASSNACHRREADIDRARARQAAMLELGLAIVCASALVALFTIPIEAVPQVTCPFRYVTGLPCLTCGGTRSSFALRDGNVVKAFLLNPLFVLSVAAAFGVVVRYVLAKIFGWRLRWPDLNNPAVIRAIRICVPLSLIGQWIYLAWSGV